SPRRRPRRPEESILFRAPIRSRARAASRATYLRVERMLIDIARRLRVYRLLLINALRIMAINTIRQYEQYKAWNQAPRIATFTITARPSRSAFASHAWTLLATEVQEFAACAVSRSISFSAASSPKRAATLRAAREKPILVSL